TRWRRSASRRSTAPRRRRGSGRRCTVRKEGEAMTQTRKMLTDARVEAYRRAARHGKGRVMTRQDRREFLKAATAATTAIAMGGWPRRALSAQTGALAASEWDYHTSKELVAALQARKISASELTDHVIARIEALDPRINAVVVRDFERA